MYLQVNLQLEHFIYIVSKPTEGTEPDTLYTKLTFVNYNWQYITFHIKLYILWYKYRVNNDKCNEVVDRKEFLFKWDFSASKCEITDTLMVHYISHTFASCLTISSLAMHHILFIYCLWVRCTVHFLNMYKNQYILTKCEYLM